MTGRNRSSVHGVVRRHHVSRRLSVSASRFNRFPGSCIAVPHSGAHTRFVAGEVATAFEAQTPDVTLPASSRSASKKRRGEWVPRGIDACRGKGVASPVPRKKGWGRVQKRGAKWVPSARVRECHWLARDDRRSQTLRKRPENRLKTSRKQTANHSHCSRAIR